MFERPPVFREGAEHVRSPSFCWRTGRQVGHGKVRSKDGYDGESDFQHGGCCRLFEGMNPRESDAGKRKWIRMKQNICVLSLFAFAWTGFSQGTFQTVVPNGFANAEGNSSSADLFNTSGSIFQQVYSASDFGIFGGTTGRIDGMSFRFDGASGQRFVGLWPGTSFILSTTTRSPDSLIPAYRDNAGPDSVGVFGGPLGIVATNTAPSLRPFEIHVRFTTPFFYDPSKGNLSLVMSAAPGPTNLLLDAQLRRAIQLAGYSAVFRRLAHLIRLGSSHDLI